MASGRIPPLRRQPYEEDRQFDGARLDYAWRRWDSQTQALRLRDRSIEECVRMVCGQQHIVWNAVLQRYVDVTHWMTDEERRWRQRPTMDRLGGWFMTTHARLTENAPIITFLPGPDAIDAELADVLDTIYKSLWRELGMLDVNDRLMAWLCVAGRGHLHTRLDLTKGPMRVKLGRTVMPMLNPATNSPVLGPDGQPLLHEVDDVPMDSQGNALAILTPQGLVATGQPALEREGSLVVDVLSPLEVRGQWGAVPWHLKPWHAVKSYLTPDEVYDKWNVRVEPDVDGYAADSAGELERLMFGAGYFGAAQGKVGTDLGAPQSTSDKFCEVLTYYEAPQRCHDEPLLEQTPENPGGRFVIATRQKLLVDSVRPMPWKYTSPVRCYDFIRIPGRPQGSTPLERLTAPQRAYNRTWGSIIEHTRLMTNPIGFIDERSGLQVNQISNAPGQRFKVTRVPGVAPLEFVAPPALGADAYKALALLAQEMDQIGSLEGTEGDPPSRDASGALVQELRFNSDRYIGPASRRNVEEYARWAEDVREFIKLLWDREKILTYAGEDNVARTVVVYPYLLTEGHVDVVPDVESMYPEGRGERQAKVYQMWRDGMFGDPMSPRAISRYLELARFPNLSRAAKPGGPERATAEQILGRLVQGDPSVVTIWWPWYDPMVHLEVLHGFAAGPEFLKLAPEIQRLVMARWEFVMANQQAMMAQMPTAPPPQGGPQLPPAPGLSAPGMPPAAPGGALPGRVAPSASSRPALPASADRRLPAGTGPGPTSNLSQPRS